MMKQALIALLLISSLVISQNGSTRDPQSWKNEFEKMEGPDWLFRFAPNGSVRAIYGLSTRRQVRDENSAFQFLSDYSEMFGLKDVSLLHSVHVEKGAFGATYVYGQFVGGLPVVGAEFAVHTNSSGYVISAGGQYYRIDQALQGKIADAEISRRTAARFRFADGGVSRAQLMVLPISDTSCLVWKVDVQSNRWLGRSYTLYVDALRPQYVLRTHRTYAEFDGSGTVYEENPVITPTPSTQHFSYLDDSTSLSGSFVKTYNSNLTQVYGGLSTLPNFTTASDPSRNYNYVVTDPKFTEAMAYYHLNVVHDRWRSLGFNKLNVQIPVLVNLIRADGSGGVDNAFYFRGFSSTFRNGVIMVGAGKFFENFGHDADVYYHEYGHAVLDRAKPGFFETIESNYSSAFHEAFGDVSAVAINENSKLGEFALRSRATKKFLGRNLDNRNRFPQNAIEKPTGKTEPHYTGLIAGGVWWDLQKQIGIPAAQRILYRSLPILNNDMTFFDLRDSMLTADRRINNGSNAERIQLAFANHGLDGEDPGQKGRITVQSLKTALLKKDFTFALRSTFKRGDWIAILAAYTGSGLTPGYNLIGENVELTGPRNSGVDAYYFFDEAVNGLRTGIKGAWVAELDTYEESKPGTYTVTLQCRLGGTMQRSEPKSVTFRLN